MQSVVPALASALALSLVLATSAAAQPAGAPMAKYPHVIDSSFTTADGARTLQESIEIEAPVHTLWQAFVDPVQFERWDAPMAAIDLKVGGTLEATYDTDHKLGDPDNIKHRIVTFLPDRLLVFQNIQAPHMLPHAEMFQHTVTVVQYEALSPTRTRVTFDSTGWGSDPASNALYGFFQDGNASLLEKMKQVYEGK